MLFVINSKYYYICHDTAQSKKLKCDSKTHFYIIFLNTDITNQAPIDLKHNLLRK